MGEEHTTVSSITSSSCHIFLNIILSFIVKPSFSLRLKFEIIAYFQGSIIDPRSRKERKNETDKLRAQRSGPQLKRKKPASCSFRRKAETERCWLLLRLWCRWPDSNRHALRHLILSHLLHTEYRRTRPPAEVVDGHQKALPILLFLKMMCKKLRFVCHFRSFQFGREFWILEGHRRDVAHKQSTTAHAIDSFVANTL